MVMRAQVSGALLTEDPKAQRGALRGGCNNAKVLHDSSASSLRRRYERAGCPLVEVTSAAARQAASTAVDAIDALLRELFLLRGHLVQEMRCGGGAAGPQVA
jgi:hypothetical protein